MEQKLNSTKSRTNVFFVGLLSFFGGIGQDIFLPLLPIYLATVLKLDKSLIGLSEGLVTSSASIFKMVAGYLTDKFKSRKSLVFVGYFLSLVSRPLLAIITNSWAVLFFRFLDGTGKGIKAAPKDALIADSSVKDERGRSFGIARMLDTFGSVVGPILLSLLLFVFQNDSNKFQYIFYLSAIPLIITLLILVFKVREVAPLEKKQQANASVKLPRKFYLFMGIVLLFGLGNSSDSFLILRAENVGVTLLSIPLVYAVFNFIYAATSVPLGTLSDKIGREKVIILGWLAYALAYLGFGLANQPLHIWLLFAFYGVYYATTEGVAKALIADIVVPEHRGKAYGLYNALIGLVVLPASIMAGYLWDKVNSAAPFFFGAGMATLATILLLLFISHYYPRKIKTI